MTQMIDAGQNPDLANSLIASAVAEAPVTAEVRAVEPPPDGSVTLLAGLVNQLEGTLAKDAEIRELTGADEEALAVPTVARSISKYVQTLAQRGTVSLGGRKPTKDDLGSLIIGDREMLLIAIRKATYGPEVELTTVCPECGDRDPDFRYDLNEAEIRPLDRDEDALYGFDVELPSGRTAKVTLPRAADQDALLQSEKKNTAELDTMMLSRCVSKLDGEMLLGEGKLRNLTVKDRRELLKQINEKTPGPRLGEAKRTCRACEQEFDLGIGLLDIFRA